VIKPAFTIGLLQGWAAGAARQAAAKAAGSVRSASASQPGSPTGPDAQMLHPQRITLILRSVSMCRHQLHCKCLRMQ
jgi:hypothetical protein